MKNRSSSEHSIKSHTFEGAVRAQPVKRDGRKIQFTPPGTPTLVFDGDSFTATLEGIFVDYWEKIK